MLIYSSAELACMITIGDEEGRVAVDAIPDE